MARAPRDKFAPYYTPSGPLPPRPSCDPGKPCLLAQQLQVTPAMIQAGRRAVLDNYQWNLADDEVACILTAAIAVMRLK